MKKEISTEKYIKEKWKVNAALFLGGQGISMFGSMLVHYAVMWYVTLKTGSGAVMTLFSVAAVLPTFFISPFGGVWADKYNKKYLINISDGAIALVTLAMAAAFFFGAENIWLLFVCSVARGLGQGVQTPAVNALIPEIVPEENLTRVNGISASIQSICMIAAPMAAGAVLTFMPIGAVLFIDVFTAVIGIAVVFFFVKNPLAVRKEKKAQTGYFTDIKEGLSYMKGKKFIREFMIFAAIFQILFAPAAMMGPLQAARDFGGEVWRLSAVEISFSAGMLLGGLIIGVWGGFKNRAHSFVFASFLLGAETVALGIIGLFGEFWTYAACIAITGMTMPLFMTPVNSILQTNVEKEYMGRVFGVFSMISGIMMPLGMAAFGPLGDVVSIDLIFIATGAAMFFLTFFVLGSKEMLKAGKLPPKDGGSAVKP
ncbi:MAG: MFS transporter [Clostridiales bacterium]|jgi:DHA3 family macrolide efflux protein-like MFS transporter|nr:MFS transporter [Clostridiales bacterium]